MRIENVEIYSDELNLMESWTAWEMHLGSLLLITDALGEHEIPLPFSDRSLFLTNERLRSRSRPSPG